MPLGVIGVQLVRRVFHPRQKCTELRQLRHPPFGRSGGPPLGPVNGKPFRVAVSMVSVCFRLHHCSGWHALCRRALRLAAFRFAVENWHGTCNFPSFVPLGEAFRVFLQTATCGCPAESFTAGNRLHVALRFAGHRAIFQPECRLCSRMFNTLCCADFYDEQRRDQ